MVRLGRYEYSRKTTAIFSRHVYNRKETVIQGVNSMAIHPVDVAGYNQLHSLTRGTYSGIVIGFDVVSPRLKPSHYTRVYEPSDLFLVALATRGIGARDLGPVQHVAQRWVEEQSATVQALIAAVRMSGTTENSGMLLPTMLSGVKDLLPIRSRNLSFNNLPLVEQRLIGN